MPRPTFPGASARLVADVSRRRIAAGLGVVAVAALAIGIVISAGLPGSSQGAGTPAKASGSSRRCSAVIWSRPTRSPGTLSYANAADGVQPRQRDGHMPADDRSGDQARSDAVQGRQRAGRPVQRRRARVPDPCLTGSAMGRTSRSSSRTCVALGYDPNHDITIDDTFDSATAAAVERWQAALGETQTGVDHARAGGIPPRLAADHRRRHRARLQRRLGAGSGSGSGSGSSASTTPAPPRLEFVELDHHDNDEHAPTTTASLDARRARRRTTSSVHDDVIVGHAYRAGLRARRGRRRPRWPRCWRC